MKRNGWRAGTDPTQRWLRIVSTVVVLGIMVLIVVREQDPQLFLMAIGALLVLMGFAVSLKLPDIFKGDTDGRSDDDRA